MTLSVCISLQACLGAYVYLEFAHTARLSSWSSSGALFMSLYVANRFAPSVKGFGSDVVLVPFSVHLYVGHYIGSLNDKMCWRHGWFWQVFFAWQRRHAQKLTGLERLPQAGSAADVYLRAEMHLGSWMCKDGQVSEAGRRPILGCRWCTLALCLLGGLTQTGLRRPFPTETIIAMIAWQVTDEIWQQTGSIGKLREQLTHTAKTSKSKQSLATPTNETDFLDTSPKHNLQYVELLHVLRHA